MPGVRVKEAGKRVFAAFGLETASAGAGASDRASMTGALLQLVMLGRRPKTVIDVGVASETPELCEEIPDAQLLLGADRSIP
jgi:hypothetical protein